jgi:hypothetical protein
VSHPICKNTGHSTFVVVVVVTGRVNILARDVAMSDVAMVLHTQHPRQCVTIQHRVYILNYEIYHLGTESIPGPIIRTSGTPSPAPSV